MKVSEFIAILVRFVLKDSVEMMAELYIRFQDGNNEDMIVSSRKLLNHCINIGFEPLSAVIREYLKASQNIGH